MPDNKKEGFLKASNQHNFFPIVSSVIDPDALKNWVAATYGIQDPSVRVELWRRGVNDTYLVSGNLTKLVLRIYRAAWRSLDEILYEMELLLHLAKAGVPVSIPIATSAGELVQSIPALEGPRFVVLFTRAPGKEAASVAYDSELYGRSLGQIHSAADAFESGRPRFSLNLEKLVIEPLASIRPLIEGREDDLLYLENVANTLQTKLEAGIGSRLQTGVCHGDAYGGNAHLHEDVVTFFDFDFCGVGWRAYDLAAFRWWRGGGDKNWWMGGNRGGEENWQAFIKGYRSVRDLPRINWKLVPTLVIARAVWQRGLQVRFSNHEGRESLSDDSWDRFFRGLHGLVDQLDVAATVP